jgi:hypothetical protein
MKKSAAIICPTRVATKVHQLCDGAVIDPTLGYPDYRFHCAGKDRDVYSGLGAHHRLGTTQQTRDHMKYWSEAISTVCLEGAFRRAFSCRPEELLGRRAQRAEQTEALASMATVKC